MGSNAYLNSIAIWLNDHAFTVTMVMSLTALVVELVNRAVSGRVSNATQSQWVQTWLTNVGLLACAFSVSWLLAFWLSPAFSTALSAQTGLLAWLDLASTTYTGHVLLGVLLLDLLSYSLHRLFHQVPLLWRLHQVHHSDSAVNASTHFRQHPLQDVLLPLVQLPVLWLLGISGVSWVLYAALSTAAQLWQHAEAGRAAQESRWLSLVLITPLTHLTHHDQRRAIHDHNYGTLFSFWDRLLGTYIKAPPEFHVGLPGSSSRQKSTILASFLDCLCMPFRTSTKPGVTGVSNPFRTHLQGKK